MGVYCVFYNNGYDSKELLGIYTEECMAESWAIACRQNYSIPLDSDMVFVEKRFW